MIHKSFWRQTLTISSISFLVNNAPDGLCGLFKRRTLLLLVTELAKSLGFIRKLFSFLSSILLTVPPAAATTPS